MEIKLQPGEFLIREKTQCEALFIIKEGQLEVYRNNNGEKVLLGMISSGEYVGETAIFKGGQNNSNVVALTPVIAVRLGRAAIETQLKTVPGWLIALTRGLIERLHSANDIMRKNNFKDETLADKVKAIGDKYRKAEDVPAPTPAAPDAAAAPTPDDKDKKKAS